MKEEYDAIPQEEIERKNDKLAEQLSFAIFNQIVWVLFLFLFILITNKYIILLQDKINKENLLTADRDICNQKKKNNNDACTNIFFDEKTKICIVSRLETKTCKVIYLFIFKIIIHHCFYRQKIVQIRKNAFPFSIMNKIF